MKTIMNRRRLLGGAVALVGSSVTGMAGASFPASSSGNFRAASTTLKDYGIAVSGDDSRSDQIFMEIRPLAETQYTQTILTRTDSGAIIPCVRTSHLEARGGPVTSFEHFHGEIIPCVRTRIEGHALATHELLDSDEGGIVPCVRTAAQMLEGGHIGAVEFEHLHPADDGLIIPCVRTTIDADHALATHELLDADQGGIVPCVRTTAEMLDGGHIGEVVATHFHPGAAGGIIPCVRTTISADHSVAALELFDAGAGSPPDPVRPALRLTSEMLKGGVLGAVEVTVTEPQLGFAVQVGDRRYVLRDGQLVEETAPR